MGKTILSFFMLEFKNLMDFPPINPVAFYFFSFPVRWYGLAYVISFMIGERYCLSLIRFFEDIKPKHIEDFLLWAVAGILVGGRLGHALIYETVVFCQEPVKLLRVWEGGMSFHGGLLGAFFACWLYAYRYKIPLGQLSDILVCAIPIGLFWGRLGNFINQELYGHPTTLPWGVVFPLIDDLKRHPSQLYQVLGEGLILGGLLRYALTFPVISATHGSLTGLFLIGYGFIRFFLEFLRYPEFYLGQLTIGQWLTLPIIALGFIIIFYATKKRV